MEKSLSGVRASDSCKTPIPDNTLDTSRCSEDVVALTAWTCHIYTATHKVLETYAKLSFMRLTMICCQKACFAILQRKADMAID